MAYFRFHKSRSILPGVRVNISKSGPSLTVGPKGMKANIGPQGIRTAVGLPGSGLSAITQTSWKAMGRNPKAPSGKDGKVSDDLGQIVDAAMDGMTKSEQREFFIKCIQESTLAEVKNQQIAFQAHIDEHISEVDEGDKADIEDMRRIYVDTIATKEHEAQQEILLPLGLAALAGISMWVGVVQGNGWAIAGGLILFLAASVTKGGQRFWNGLLILMLGLMGLTIAAAIIGFATLIILALTGHL